MPSQPEVSAAERRAIAKAESALYKAAEIYEPLQARLEAAQAIKEAHAREDRDAILKATKPRDAARIKMMNAQDELADLRAAAGLQPETIGVADRG